jgi:hypothetical protein
MEGITMTTTESKQAARIHAAELGRTHRIFSHLRTVRARALRGTILADDIREKLSQVCLWAYADEDRRANPRAFGRAVWGHVADEVEALRRVRSTITADDFRKLTADDFRKLDTGYGLNRARKATMPGSRVVELGNIGAAVLKLHWLNDPEEGAGRTRFARAKWSF